MGKKKKYGGTGLFLMGLFVLFFVGGAFAQVDLACSGPLTGDVGEDLSPSKATVTSLSPSVRQDYNLQWDCGGVHNGSSGNTNASIGGSFQTIREHPIGLRFDSETSGACEVVLTLEGEQQSCSIEYVVGNPPPSGGMVSLNVFLAGVLVLVALAIALWAFGGKK